MFEDNNEPNVGGNEPTNIEPNTPTEPAPISLTDDSFVLAPGRDKPVKYGELFRGFQSDYTKKQQALARERAEWEGSKRTEEGELRKLATELLSRQRQSSSPNTDPTASMLEKLRQVQYLSGADAAQLFEHLQGNLGGQSQALQQRDQVIQGMHNYIQNLAKEVQQLKGTYTTQSWEGNLKGVVKQLGYPDEAIDLAKEIYLAYEGDDLDAEFPSILRNRWEQLQNLFDSRRKAAVDAARKKPFDGIPKRGGAGSAANPLGLKGNENAKDTADKLWNMMSHNDE